MLACCERMRTGVADLKGDQVLQVAFERLGPILHHRIAGLRGGKGRTDAWRGQVFAGHDHPTTTATTTTTTTTITTRSAAKGRRLTEPRAWFQLLCGNSTCSLLRDSSTDQPASLHAVGSRWQELLAHTRLFSQ